MCIFGIKSALKNLKHAKPRLCASSQSRQNQETRADANGNLPKNAQITAVDQLCHKRLIQADHGQNQFKPAAFILAGQTVDTSQKTDGFANYFGGSGDATTSIRHSPVTHFNPNRFNELHAI
jgi:hypothetical protein